MTAIEIKTHIIDEVFEDECVLLSLENENFYSLNRVGTQVWKACRQGKSESEIVQHLMQTYGLDETRAKTDVECFLNELVAISAISR